MMSLGRPGSLVVLVSAAMLVVAASLSAADPQKLPGSDIIPPDRLASWIPGVTVGVPGGIPTDRNHLLDVTKDPYNADNTGAADTQPAIMKAIADAKEKEVVYLPAGTYRVDSGIRLVSKSNITIRGAGESTVIEAHLATGWVISVEGSGSSGFWNAQAKGIAITDGMARGSATLTVEDTSPFNVGQIIEITELNDPKLPVLSTSGGWERVRKQKTSVVSKTATTLTIFPPLYWTLKSELSPAITYATGQVNGVGIEDLRINAKNSKAAFVINFGLCYGSWIKNVHSQFAANYHFSLTDSLFCEVRQCNLDELNHVGSNGAGLLMAACSGGLIEDNIVFRCFPHLEINHGCSGNVFAYNFCENNFTFGIMGCSINCNHGPHNSYDLYEGNVASVFQNDGYHGSASEITAFRNWFHATCDTSEPKTDQFGRCVSLNRFSRNCSIVGNVLGRKGYTYIYDHGESATGYQHRYIYNLGLPNVGNGVFEGFAPPWKDPLNSKQTTSNSFQELDRDVRATTILKGNFNYKDNAVPESESLKGAKLPNSLYLKNKPAWFGNLNWPPFGPDTDFEKNKIPAQVRYEQLSKTK